ncbi:MAG: M14 family metallopeptidase, partial [Candidatus Eisenbacteria bacterium]
AVLFLSTEETSDQLRGMGIDFEVLIDDLEAFYSARMSQGEHRGGGNFGIFHTYSETTDELNAIHAEFPNITTAPASIGTTDEGREILSIKVSDNPNVDENEGEILFDGVHHAREIMTVEMNLSFCRYLCENYGIDPVVTQLVDSREIWFVPIVNPDGIVYNETTNPAGGGMWRKNRKVNQGSSCRGVDLNRNYDFEWVGTGSSTDPCSDVFRGPSPNSEQEIQALTNFIDAHEFVCWQSYHSVAALVLFPWGYTSAHTPDDATFRVMAAEMARDSGYQTGQPTEVLYNVNGAAFDWGYGRDDLHPKIFGFTTEIGGSGFWPAESERDGLIAENLHSNLYLCQVAGARLDLGFRQRARRGQRGTDPGETVDPSPSSSAIRRVGAGDRGDGPSFRRRSLSPTGGRVGQRGHDPAERSGRGSRSLPSHGRSERAAGTDGRAHDRSRRRERARAHGDGVAHHRFLAGSVRRRLRSLGGRVDPGPDPHRDDGCVGARRSEPDRVSARR